MTVIAGLLGCLLIVPAVFAAMQLARRSWPAFIGGSLMIGGYICYFGVLLSNMMIIAMAAHGGPIADFAAVIDASESNGSTAWVFLLFVVGNLLGTLLLAIGLLRTRAVPVWAALLIMVLAAAARDRADRRQRVVRGDGRSAAGSGVRRHCHGGAPAGSRRLAQQRRRFGREYAAETPPI